MKKAFSVVLLLLVSMWLTAQNADDYCEAANQGDAEAQYNLGVCCANGYGVTQDYKQAISWFTKAANQDHISAQFNLGVFYYKGYGVTKDSKQAIYWLTKAANQGHTKAQALLVELGRH